MWNMAKALGSCDVEVVFMTGRMKGHPERERHGNLTLYRCYDAGAHRTRGFVDQVLRIAQAHNVDWIEGADYLGECCRLLQAKSRPPVVVKAHSCDALAILRKAEIMYPWQKPLVALGLWRTFRKRADEKACLKKCNSLLVPSWRMVAELASDGLINTDHIGVIPNTIASPPAPVEKEHDRPTVFFPGKISIGKGIEYLPRIVSETGIRGLRLEIAGDDSYARGLGSMKKWLAGKLAKAEIDATFLGKLSPEEMVRAYKRAWVVVLPTKWDNFPGVVLEAMQLARPVVTTPHGGMVEMLAGTDGRIALPESKAFSREIEGLLADKELRARAGESLREKFNRAYSPEQVARTYLEYVTAIV
jgi:glycosyltransferase involved in cell wall biosynthesis